MTDKFIPFNPETAKNGDVVYGRLTGTEYLYVGKHPTAPNRIITYKVSERKLCFDAPEHMQVKAPKRLCGLMFTAIHKSVFAMVPKTKPLETLLKLWSTSAPTH